MPGGHGHTGAIRALLGLGAGAAIVVLTAAPLQAQATLRPGPRMSACTTEGALRPGELSIAPHLDSGLVATAVGAMWQPEWGRVIATLSGPGDTDHVWVKSLAGNADGLERVAEWLLEARTDTPLPDDGWLPLLIGDEGRFGLRSVELASCPPVLSTRAELSREMKQVARDDRDQLYASRPRRVDITVHAYVDETGSVVDIDIDEPSHIPEIDAAIANAVVRLARFDPARIEGIPRSSWVSIPLTVTMSLER